MSYTLGSLLCVFFIVCFNDETKIDNNVKCPNYCKCFNGANRKFVLNKKTLSIFVNTSI